MSNSDLAKRYIGKQISLISTSHVRYEGYLYTIDEQAQTVALQNVVCMGTEGRRHGDQAIGPSDTTYEFIIFRGINIQHFYVKGDEGHGKPTVDKTQELFAALGIEDEDALYASRYDRGSRNKERPSSRLVLAEEQEPKRRVGWNDESPRDYYYQNSRPYHNNQYRDSWGYPPSYPRGGGYSRGPMPRRRDRDRGRPRYDDRYDDRPPQRRGGRGRDYDQPRSGGGGGGRRPPRSTGNQTRRNPPRRKQGGNDNNNSGRRSDRQTSNRRSSQQTNRQSGGGGGNAGTNSGGRRKQAGTGEFLTKAARGEELEINENQLFDFEEAKTKFTRSSDVEVKAAATDDMGEIKASAESAGDVEENDAPEADKKISEPSDVDAPKATSATEADSNVPCYDASTSFYDQLSTDNAQRSKTGRPDMNEQRNVDAKTFGSIAQTYKSSHLRPGGGGRKDKPRNRRSTRPQNQNNTRRRPNNDRNRRQRAPPVQRQWQPRQ